MMKDSQSNTPQEIIIWRIKRVSQIIAQIFSLSYELCAIFIMFSTHFLIFLIDEMGFNTTCKTLSNIPTPM